MTTQIYPHFAIGDCIVRRCVCVVSGVGGWVGVWGVLSFQCVSRCRVKVCDCV